MMYALCSYYYVTLSNVPGYFCINVHYFVLNDIDTIFFTITANVNP